MKKIPLTVERLRRAARVLRCLAHPDRLRLVECLEHRERPVNELVERLGIGQAAVSKHLAVLRREGLVRGKVSRNYRYYSIAHPHVVGVLDCVRKHGGKAP